MFHRFIFLDFISAESVIHEIYICSNFVIELHIKKLLLRKYYKLLNFIITYISNIPQHLFRPIQFILFFFQIFNSLVFFKNEGNYTLLYIFNCLFSKDCAFIYNVQKMDSIETVWILFLHKSSQSSKHFCFLILIF